MDFELPFAADLESISDRYAHGECGAFAVACYRAYQTEGWSLVLFYHGQTPIHAACSTDDGDGYFDAYGFVSYADIESRYGARLGSAIVKEIDVELAMGFDDEDVSEADDHRRLLETLLVRCHRIEQHGNTIFPRH